MRYLRSFGMFLESVNSIILVKDRMVKYQVSFELLDISSDPIEQEQFDEDDFVEAKSYYAEYVYDEGKYSTHTHSKMLSKLVYEVSYNYDSEFEEREDIDDRDKEFEIVYSEVLEYDTYKVNDKSDVLLDNVENWFREQYDSNDYKYHNIRVEYGSNNEYKRISVRISDHTENINNIDRFGRCDYYVSIVISDNDATRNRFGETNSYERRHNEYELKFDSIDDVGDVTFKIETLFDEIIHEIKESE